ncbi:MAG: SDR family NAD(P)-dependent oxidoreductase [Gammaproteobacteria bacterium]|nr:SDR family NAD(P)-dependent oxidoreductase [Gammaproteobacteria bacterium]
MKNALVIGVDGTIGRALLSGLKADFNVTGISRKNTDYSSASLATIAGQVEQPVQLIICCIGVLHNEALTPEKNLKHVSEQQLLDYFRVNSVLPMLCMQAFVPLLDKTQTSVYLNLSAMVGSIEDNRLGGWYGYRSSKAALNMLTKTTAIETARTNKQACVATIHPGTTKSAMSKPFSGSVEESKYYSPEQSAERIINVAGELSARDTGRFFNWNGEQLPW